MKKVLLLLIGLIALGCSKSEDKKEDSSKLNLKGTKWTAIDDIAELLYGKTCTTTIEFIDDKNCQTIDIRDVRGFGSGTFVEEGIYEVRGDSVFWSKGDKKLDNKGRVSGSVLKTYRLTYTKK